MSVIITKNQHVSERNSLMMAYPKKIKWSSILDTLLATGQTFYRYWIEICTFTTLAYFDFCNLVVYRHHYSPLFSLTFNFFIFTPIVTVTKKFYLLLFLPIWIFLYTFFFAVSSKLLYRCTKITSITINCNLLSQSSKTFFLLLLLMLL